MSSVAAAARSRSARQRLEFTAESEGDRRAIRNALMIICLACFVTSIDTTVVNVALRTLERDFHASVAAVQWVITAYLLTVAGVIPISGWASRRFGARQVYVFSLALFGASSGLCALAGSLQALVAFRLLQGVAGGMLVPIGQLIAAEVAGPERMGKMASRMWMVAAAGAMIGPTLGGVLIQTLNWHWIFLVNVPFCLLATAVAVHLLPNTPPRPAGRLDLGGLARLSIGVSAVVFALSQAEASTSVITASTVIPTVVGVVFVLDFVRHALRSPNPLLDVRLCTKPGFAVPIVALFFVELAWYGVLVLLPLSFQQLRHTSPMTAGELMAPQSLGTFTGMWLSGRLSDRRLAQMLGAGGALTLVGTTTLVAGVVSTASPWLLCPTLLVAGLSAGSSWVPATAASYSSLAPDEISHASPILTVTMRLGASFGTTLAAVILATELRRSSETARGAIDAYRVGFHWDAGFWFIAGLVYACMCIVLAHQRCSRLAMTEDRCGDPIDICWRQGSPP